MVVVSDLYGGTVLSFLGAANTPLAADRYFITVTGNLIYVWFHFNHIAHRGAYEQVAFTGHLYSIGSFVYHFNQ